MNGWRVEYKPGDGSDVCYLFAKEFDARMKANALLSKEGRERKGSIVIFRNGSATPDMGSLHDSLSRAS